MNKKIRYAEKWIKTNEGTSPTENRLILVNSEKEEPSTILQNFNNFFSTIKAPFLKNS